jgi:signal transduction histidine kinase
MNLLRWFSGGEGTGVPHDPRWSWVTLALSALLAVGYGVIAFNWYFQSKLARKAESKAALARLRNLCIICAICGSILFAVNMPWIVWRCYDIVLLALAISTWRFVLKMRGLSLVDERLAQVDALEASANRYREIAELLPHMVWTANTSGDVDFSNQRWREYAGSDRTWLQAIHPDEHVQAFARWNEAITARQPFSMELRLGGPEYRTFLVNATPIVHGDAVKWLGACADIDVQKRYVLEKELQARQKSFFLNALSHDLRAPLHNILLNGHLLKLSAKDPGDVESVEMIMENAVAAGDLVTKLLDFAKVGAVDQNRIEMVPLTAALRQVERRFQPVAEQKGLHLRLVGDSEVAVSTDRQKLERIISNLVDNAIKYTKEGGVTIELAVENEICVRITDTGIGIPDQNVPYLFDEFYQVNNYERDRSKGFGMGLAICKSLAGHIGADVRLTSTSPHGSCFQVVVKGIGPDRGGRSLSETRDHAHSSEAGVCRI